MINKGFFFQSLLKFLHYLMTQNSKLLTAKRRKGDLKLTYSQVRQPCNSQKIGCSYPLMFLYFRICPYNLGLNWFHFGQPHPVVNTRRYLKIINNYSLHEIKVNFWQTSESHYSPSLKRVYKNAAANDSTTHTRSPPPPLPQNGS